MSTEQPQEGGHKKPPIPTPAKRVPAYNIEKRGDRLYSGRVWHEPYRLRRAEVVSMDDSLVEAAGIEPRPVESALFCEGVDVRIYPIRRCQVP